MPTKVERSDSERASFMLSFISSYNGNVQDNVNEEIVADTEHSQSGADVPSTEGVRRTDARDATGECIKWGDSSRDGSRE